MYWKQWWCRHGEIFCRLKCGQRPRNTQNISCYCLMLGMFRTNKSWDPYANHIAVWHSANRTGLYNMQGVLQQKMTWTSRLVNCYVVHPGFTVTSLCINTHPFHSCIKSVTLSQAHLPDINWGDLGGMPFGFTLQATNRAEGLGSGYLETWPTFMEFFVIGSLVFFQDACSLEIQAQTTMNYDGLWYDRCDFLQWSKAKSEKGHRCTENGATRFSPHSKALPCQFLSPIVFGLSDSWGRQATVTSDVATPTWGAFWNCLNRQNHRVVQDMSRKCLGFSDGVFHVECKYTSHGPHLIEVNVPCQIFDDTWCSSRSHDLWPPIVFNPMMPLEGA